MLVIGIEMDLMCHSWQFSSTVYIKIHGPKNFCLHIFFLFFFHCNCLFLKQKIINNTCLYGSNFNTFDCVIRTWHCSKC
jgi:hypothetical protein